MSSTSTNSSDEKGGRRFPSTGSSVADAAITTLIGLGAVFIGGVIYMAWYKKNVLDKIEKAFSAGYDPALELAVRHKAEDNGASGQTPGPEHLRRKEQDLIDRVIKGEEIGQYFLLLGPKGTGKATMILDAMKTIEAEGFAMCDAHPDLEVFRLRLGKALNFEYYEDTQTGLFQRRDPREGGPALDIERAFSKLEKVALRYARRTGRPLVLVVNNIHFFMHNDDGTNMLLQLQQRAEAWAAAGILTMVLTCDDFWPYMTLRKTASRMQIVSVTDLKFKDGLRAFQRLRRRAGRQPVTPEVFEEAMSITGGRLAYMAQISKESDILERSRRMLAVEKAWLQSVIGLIPDCDDDVMDEQKWSSTSWLLLREFVKQRREDERKREEVLVVGELSAEDLEELPLPKISYYRCRQIMTRADFLEDLDRANIIAIDVNHDVTPDSLLVLRAAAEVVEDEGFNELLENVLDRVDEIESLHRTRELTFKDVDAGDRIRVTVDKRGARLIED
ncbi:uncharacterized protein LAESUDRAFT_727003 [Laetiporus sulphureus 93-53]|uniref:AAA protein C-terminal winged helix domain-containing protein n=1 Tax=Laetiporus sulphureus 93-53 TaxID=1314785 RepID=A0A165DPU8_9APHY|nr:uncharacterized protein LAESUDRAFT_727003 [Laetiporus sulphureus 93-53]KZT05366.1 hypothetical protein LAESUDRAFT_727003 [Laetiporus sulphureus 93-53]